MEIVTAEAITNKRIELYIKSKDPEAAELYQRLEADGDIDPSLCFLAVSEGREKGCLILYMTKAGQASVGAALILVGEEFEQKLLLDNACEVLRKRGADYITATGDRDQFGKLGWRWTVDEGIIPPNINEESLKYWCKPLENDIEPPFAPVEYPKAMALPEPVFDLSVISEATEEKIEFIMYDTRRKRRIAERVMLILFIVLSVVLGVSAVSGGRLNRIYITALCVATGLLLLYRNIFIPRKVVRQTMENRRQKNCTGWRDFYGFSDMVMYTDLKKKRGAILPYSMFKVIYVKKDYIFLCDRTEKDHAAGHFVVTGEDNAKKEALVRLLKEKLPDAEIKN